MIKINMRNILKIDNDYAYDLEEVIKDDIKMKCRSYYILCEEKVIHDIIRVFYGAFIYETIPKDKLCGLKIDLCEDYNVYSNEYIPTSGITGVYC